MSMKNFNNTIWNGICNWLVAQYEETATVCSTIHDNVDRIKNSVMSGSKVFV